MRDCWTQNTSPRTFSTKGRLAQRSCARRPSAERPKGGGGEKGQQRAGPGGGGRRGERGSCLLAKGNVCVGKASMRSRIP